MEFDIIYFLSLSLVNIKLSASSVYGNTKFLQEFQQHILNAIVENFVAFLKA